MENLALLAFSADTRTIDTPYTLRTSCPSGRP